MQLRVQRRRLGRISHKPLNTAEGKFFPSSEWICKGVPNLDDHCCTRISAIVAASRSGMGYDPGQFVKNSITIKMFLLPDQIGRPKMPNAMRSKGTRTLYRAVFLDYVSLVPYKPCNNSFRTTSRRLPMIYCNRSNLEFSAKSKML